MRLADESATIREAYPEAYADLAVLVTELGGATGLILIVAAIYWFSRRREGAIVASYAVAGVGLVLLLKGLFAMPRPPEEVYLATLDDDPYGFPSGHAFMSVVVYGGLLVAFDRLRDPLSVAAVATLVAAISFSRIVLGFHYLGDIVAGAAIGIVALFVLHRVVDGDPTRGFAIGGIVAIPAVVVSGADPYALVALGAAIGGTAASTRLESVPPLRSRLDAVLLAIGGGGYLVAVRTLESVLTTISPAAIVLTNAVLVGGILLAPAAVGLLDTDRPGSRP